MKYLSKILPISLVSCSLIIASTSAYAGKNKPRPFNFEKISENVHLLNLPNIEKVLGGHTDQARLESLPAAEAFVEAFEIGDELFEIEYNALDGIGVNVGNGQRFTRIPRLDLDGPRAWASIFPSRTTGPNGDSCLSCHNDPVADGGGGINSNSVRIDPQRKQAGFIERQTPHIFGMGGVQLLAEEMTTTLQAARNTAIQESCETKEAIHLKLEAKGVRFGQISASCDHVSYHKLRGIDKDLVVKPFKWKGLTAFVRDFVRGSAHQDIGMQAQELVGDEDGDFDDITQELSVGDITSLAIYAAGQQRPVTKLELNQVIDDLSDEELDQFGLPLSADDIASIERGEQVFNDVKCSVCHVPTMTIASPIYSEPSNNINFRDSVFPAGEGVELPKVAITFDLTQDIFVNEIELPSGQTLGQFEKDRENGATVRLFGDLKRHNMGRGLKEDIDEGNVGASVFLTENLWGVGSTAPYLHDGRATTLAEAIAFHGGEATKSRRLFNAASDSEKADLVAFLNNLVLFLEGE